MVRESLTLDRGRIRIADALLVSLQRVVAPASPLPPDTVPRSHGLAPTAVAPGGEVIVSVAAGEAVWLGFEAVDRSRPIRACVRAEGPPLSDPVTDRPRAERSTASSTAVLVCPPDSRLVGVDRADGCHVFGTDVTDDDSRGVGELSVIAWVPARVEVPIRLVRPDEFTRITGVVPDPIDPGAAYGGWRLP